MASRLVLVLGDLFIPDRALDIPLKFKKLLTPGKIGQILCLGNLTDISTYEYLRSLAPDLQLVRGDFDLDLQTQIHSQSQANTTHLNAHPSASTPNAIPLSKTIVLGNNLRIGFTHGHTIIPLGDPDALLIAARQMDVDVLLWAGGTGKFEAYELEGRFFVNPGSATGAVSTCWVDDGENDGGGGKGGKVEDENANNTDGSTPSFVLMDVQGDVLVLYVYMLKDGPEGAVTVEKVSYRRGGNGNGVDAG